MAESSNRFPNLSKLSVAVLENYVRPVLGEKALQEIRSPLVSEELRAALATALGNTEKRFQQEHDDRAVGEALLNLPLADLPSMAAAVKAFHDRPTDQTFLTVLRNQLVSDFPTLTVERVNGATASYVRILRQELVVAIPAAREKLTGLAVVQTEENTAQLIEKLERIITLLMPKVTEPRLLGSIPPRPSLIIGREDNLLYLKRRLGIGTATAVQPLTVVRGWPGVGKTTLAAYLAHEPEIGEAFPDGVLWTALGETPNLFNELATWGRALGTDEIGRALTLEEASAQLRAILRDKRMLLIVDDVWETEHALPFKVGGHHCAQLFTTRQSDIARALADKPEEIYPLPVLTDEKGIELLATLTPSTVAQHPEEAQELVHDLEGLPLAIQVAGRLLSVEVGMGWGVADLLRELHEGAKLLAAKAPADRADLVKQTTPTVAALLQKSSDRLDDDQRLHFAFLGAFAPKPATFDLEAMAAVWETTDPRPTARVLVGRGLLEPVGERFQMHALLVMHARSLLDDE